jgi:RHS repeat-associated protein
LARRVIKSKTGLVFHFNGCLTTTYTYDNGGMLSGVDYSDATPDVTYVTRDRMGRPTQITDGTGTHNLTYHHDSSPDTVSLPQVAAGFILDYGNDGLGRRNSLQLKDGSTTLFTHSYTYDGMSRLLTVSSTAELPLGTATYARVPGTNLLSSTVFNNGSTNVLTVDRDYDSLTRLESITSTPSASSAKSFTYVYNDRDQRTRCTLADGSYWVYAYDDLGQVTSGIKYDADDVAIPGCGFGYDFDDIGNRLSTTSDLTGTATYDPNTLNQYESRTVPGIIPVIGTANADTVVKIHRKALGDGPAAFIVPDRTGTIFHKNIAVDNSSGPVAEEIDVYCHKHLPDPTREIAAKASRTVTVPGSPQIFEYDADGNLTSDGIWDYTWDAENRLIEVADNVGARSRGRTVFTYDFQSRRVGKKTYSWDTDHWSLITDHRFAWDGWNLVAIFNASNEIQRSFCWAGLGDLVADTDHIAGKSYLPIYDGNKNIHGYVDAADGSLVYECDFDPFGRIVQQSGTGDFPFRFASYFRDEETGMVYYGYRYYNPELGRFICQVPIEETGGENLFAAVGNNHISRWDRLGLEWTITRDPEKPRADACSNSPMDTVHDLAKLTGLDTADYRKWLKQADGGDFTGLPKPKIDYTIPNTVVVVAGTGQAGVGMSWLWGKVRFDHPVWYQTIVFRGVAERYKAGIESAGYNVVYVNNYSGHLFWDHISSSDTTGLMFAGHADINRKMLLLPNNQDLFRMRHEYYLDMFNEAHNIEDARRYAESAQLYLNIAREQAPFIDFNASKINQAIKHKLSYLVLLACEANEAGNWATVYANSSIRHISQGPAGVGPNSPYIAPK